MENLEKLNKQNLTIFYALFAGQIIFLLVVGYLLRTSGPKNPEMAAGIQIALPLITLAGVFGSIFIFKFQMKSVLNETDDLQKINKYRGALLSKFALLEGANIFVIISYMLTGSNLAFIISFCLLILFILNKPSLERLKEDLEIQ
jgi:hypothetical protein